MVMKMNDVAKYERPREKFERYGVQKLADHELLAIVLGSGTKGTNVIELSKKILKTIEQIGLETLSPGHLIAIKGLGKAKVAQVMVMLEFGRRKFIGEVEVIITPEKVFELCSDIRMSRKEHFVAFYLNSRNALISREIISLGTLDASLVHPREVFEPVLRHGAAAILLAHNHPSGDLNPSLEDEEVTRRLADISKIFGVEFIDHVIVTKSRFLSLKQSGVIY